MDDLNKKQKIKDLAMKMVPVEHFGKGYYYDKEMKMIKYVPPKNKKKSKFLENVTKPSTSKVIYKKDE